MQENSFEYIILKAAPFCLARKALQPKHDCHFKYVNFYILFKFHLKLEMKLKMSFSKQRSLCLCHNVLTHPDRDNMAAGYFADDDFKFIFKYDNCTFQFETWRLFCLRHNHWTQVLYCGPHKMTAILQTNLKCIFLHGNCYIFLEISFKFENTLDNVVNDIFKYFSWMETFAVFIHITVLNYWLKSASIYADAVGSSRRQAIICRVPNWYWQHKNRVTCPMNYVLLTSNSYEMSLNTSQ